MHAASSRLCRLVTFLVALAVVCLAPKRMDAQGTADSPGFSAAKHATQLALASPDTGPGLVLRTSDAKGDTPWRDAAWSDRPRALPFRADRTSRLRPRYGVDLRPRPLVGVVELRI